MDLRLIGIANRYTCKIQYVLIRKEGCKNDDLNMYKQEIYIAWNEQDESQFIIFRKSLIFMTTDQEKSSDD